MAEQSEQSIINKLSNLIPEVSKPAQKYLAFNERLKWTLIILISYLGLSTIPLFGLGQNALQAFESLSIILGANFGSLMSLGIGPIVTASIILQLLAGSGILNIDLTSKEGRAYFQSLQKVLSILFIIFEAFIYVYMGGLTPTPGLKSYAALQVLLVVQLAIGGFLVMMMDEVVSKWGFGSGISLFIVAGVAQSIFVRLLSPFTTAGTLGYPFSQLPPVGKVFEIFYSLANSDVKTLALAFWAIIATAIVFVISVFVQAMKVEIPLSFGRVRGYGLRWPLNFLYTSNIPVILVAALMANIQLWARLLQNWGRPILGTFTGNSPSSGLVLWLEAPLIFNKLITGSLVPFDILHAFVYILFMIGGAVLFSIFWVHTSGMDAKSQAKQILASGLQIPGFRADERILERVISRYIMPLTVMGGIAVGFLAAMADISGALSRGTGILLSVMILYQLYQQIAREHLMEMSPMVRKFIAE